MSTATDGKYQGTYVFTYPDGAQMGLLSGDIWDAVVRKSGKEIVIEYLEDEELVTVRITSFEGERFLGTWRSDSEHGTVDLRLSEHKAGIKLEGTWASQGLGSEGKFNFELQKA